MAASGTTWSPAPTSWATPVPEPRTPRTAASCNLVPARQRWGCRPASSSPPAHPLPAPQGRGLEAKEKYPFGFFLLCFFFLREVIFYSGFILKEEHKQKKKKTPKHIYLTLPFIFPAFRKLHICLKTKEGSSRSQGIGVLLQSRVSAFLPSLQPPPWDPMNMVPERQVWSLLCHLPREEG